MNPEIEPKHKKLTRFLCQELLYDYVLGMLDCARTNDVDEYLPTCRDSQRELQSLKKGLAYAEDVASIQVSASLREALQAFEPAWKKRLRLWTLWSSQRGWRMLPYVFLAGAAGLGVYVTQPWRSEPHKDVVIVEQWRSSAPESPGAEVLPPKLEPAANLYPPSALSLLVTNSVQAPQAPSEESKSSAEPAGRVSEAAKAEQASSEEDKAFTGSGKGTLYRSELEVSDFAVVWPTIRDKIIGLEGKAAGSVELGWLRHPRESYFHFSLPESNLPELQTFLKTFGPVRISKVRHPRVMPEGQIRIILTVKDGDKDEGEAEAP